MRTSIIRDVIPPDASKDEARERLRSMGPELGSGYSTLAYLVRRQVMDIPEARFRPVSATESCCEPVKVSTVERVLRVSSHDRGIRLTFETAMQHQDDPWAPKVYDMFDIQDGCFVAEMELLQDHPEPYAVQYWKTRADETPEGFSKSSSGPKEALLEISPFMRAIHEAYSVPGSNLWYDLHRKNVMARKNPDGTLQAVILDPVFS